ncbi:hypothetical protein D9M70_529270 [compost metagenome]
MVCEWLLPFLAARIGTATECSFAPVDHLDEGLSGVAGNWTAGLQCLDCRRLLQNGALHLSRQ